MTEPEDRRSPVDDAQRLADIRRQQLHITVEMDSRMASRRQVAAAIVFLLDHIDALTAERDRFKSSLLRCQAQRIRAEAERDALALLDNSPSPVNAEPKEES